MKLTELQTELKMKRNFDALRVMNQKNKLINQFFKINDLDSVVIGLSGGIDSALVLKMMLKAAQIKNSPLKKVVGVFMPIYTQGITGQKDAEHCVNQLVHSCKGQEAFSYLKNDLSHVAYEYFRSMGINNSFKDEAWIKGQIASIIRTPVIYGQAAVLQSLGYKSIVAGTTNRDEGAYIGFFGKASDGMVDLQPIADLHKSEVIELSKILNVPSEIVERTPKGDVWDAKCDEEMIGAPYWFLEMYQQLKSLDQLHVLQNLDGTVGDFIMIQEWCQNIETIHRKNKHKYEVGSPAHYIDVLPRTI